MTGRALELPKDLFVAVKAATDEDWQLAAELSAGRMRRCTTGSATWSWHAWVVAEHDRRRRRLRLVTS